MGPPPQIPAKRELVNLFPGHDQKNTEIKLAQRETMLWEAGLAGLEKNVLFPTLPGTSYGMVAIIFMLVRGRQELEGKVKDLPIV